MRRHELFVHPLDDVVHAVVFAVNVEHAPRAVGDQAAHVLVQVAHQLVADVRPARRAVVGIRPKYELVKILHVGRGDDVVLHLRRTVDVTKIGAVRFLRIEVAPTPGAAVQPQAEPGRYLAVALGVKNLHVRGALAAPAAGAAAHVHLVKILRLHRDRNHRQRRLPPDEVRGRLDRPDPLAAHEGRRAKQPGFIQFDRPIHPLALGGGLGAVARVADVHRAGSLGGDAHLHAGLMNARLGRKLQLRLDRLGLLRPCVGFARRGRQEKAKLTRLGLSAAVRLVGYLLAVADAVHDLPVGGAKFYFAAFPGQPKTRVQCSRQKSQPGDQAHVGAAPAGVQARDGQHVFALSQQVHMGREVEPIRRAGLASLRGHAVRVQFFVGGVHCRDARAVQIGDKAVVKIHLQHQRLR